MSFFRGEILLEGAVDVIDVASPFTVFAPRDVTGQTTAALNLLLLNKIEVRLLSLSNDVFVDVLAVCAFDPEVPVSFGWNLDPGYVLKSCFDLQAKFSHVTRNN